MGNTNALFAIVALRLPRQSGHHPELLGLFLLGGRFLYRTSMGSPAPRVVQRSARRSADGFLSHVDIRCLRLPSSNHIVAQKRKYSSERTRRCRSASFVALTSTKEQNTLFIDGGRAKRADALAKGALVELGIRGTRFHRNIARWRTGGKLRA